MSPRELLIGFHQGAEEERDCSFPPEQQWGLRSLGVIFLCASFLLSPLLINPDLFARELTLWTHSSGVVWRDLRPGQGFNGIKLMNLLNTKSTEAANPESCDATWLKAD